MLFFCCSLLSNVIIDFPESVSIHETTFCSCKPNIFKSSDQFEGAIPWQCEAAFPTDEPRLPDEVLVEPPQDRVVDTGGRYGIVEIRQRPTTEEVCAVKLISRDHSTDFRGESKLFIRFLHILQLLE